MRVAWLTPFNELSAIARISLSVCEQLKSQCREVSIIRTERERLIQAAPLATRLPVRWWHDIDPAELSRHSDVIAVTVGDNFDFHAGIFPFLSKATCLGILHDFHIYGLFHGWLASIRDSERQHDRVIRQYYGEDALEFARAARRGEASLTDISLKIPMLEWVSSRCGGAMVHANFYRARVERSCAGPVRMAYLSQDPRNVPPSKVVASNDEIVISTVGIINPNKCADAVIRAISMSDFLKTRCRYKLVGTIDDTHRARLLELAKRLDVAKIDILGRVDDNVLQQELNRTNVFCCLRRPVLEGASASAIEAMMTGRPAIVCDAGFYAELPNDSVIKISADFADAELANALERLVQHPEMRQSLGERGRRWAISETSTDKYVGVLMQLMQAFVATKPAQDMARRLGDDVAQLGITAGDPAITRVANCMSELFDPGNSISTKHT